MSRPSLRLISLVVPCLMLVVACKGKDEGASTSDPGSSAASVARVKIPEAGCEIGVPSGMEVAKASANGFTLVPKGKNPLFDGTLVNILPVGSMGSIAPPDAKDLKMSKDKKNADGSVEREGSFNNGIQTLHVAEYVYPLGKDFLHCKIQAGKAERRDEVAKVCSALAPKKI